MTMKVASFNSASALAVALVLATSPASAQTAAPQQPAAAEQETGGLPDIVVTAQKRFESAQQVPIAISARSEEHTSELRSLMRISYAVFCLKIKTTLPQT